MNVRDALRAASERLAQTSTSARLDAELLMAYAMGESRDAVLLRRSDDDAPPEFDALVQRRLSQEPLAYIVQSREFWSLDFSVGPGVLIPRPDSETLLETALRALAGRPPSTILDLGTGSGALLLSALTEWPAAKGVGIDQSDTALAYARKNAERLGLAGRAQFLKGHWGDDETDRYDLILCNPPYVDPAASLMPDVADFEPQDALFADEAGMADYRYIVPQLPELLSVGGIACLELGAGQAAAVTELCAQQGLVSAVSGDLSGHDRCLLIHS
jgi:release factor glutamine methyltransferase